MIGFGAIGSYTPPSAGVTILQLRGTSSKGTRMVKIEFGCPATPANVIGSFALKRFTTAGVLNAGGSPAGAVGTTYYSNQGLGLTPDITIEHGAWTSEPTYVSGPGIIIDINQQAPYIWPAPEEMWAPSGTANGWALYYISGPLVAWDITPWFEQ